MNNKIDFYLIYGRYFDIGKLTKSLKKRVRNLPSRALNPKREICRQKGKIDISSFKKNSKN